MLKRILILLLLLNITACSKEEAIIDNPINTSDSETDISEIYKEDHIKKVLSDQEINALLNDDIKKYSIDNLGYFDIDSIKNINKDFSDISFINYNGDTINLNDYKGKKVILDFVTNTCPSCQAFSKEEYNLIKANNPDIIFIQIFLRGNINDIAAFYQEAGQEFNKEFTIPQSKENEELYNSLKIGYVPCFVFLNEDSIITYTNVGDVKNENFNHHLELAYGDKALHKLIDEEMIKDIQRNYLDIKNDINPSVVDSINKLNTFNINQDMFDKMTYTDIAKTITPYIIESYDGKLLSEEEYLNHKVLLNFFIANEENDKINKTIADALRQVQDENSEYIIINFALEYDDIPVDVYLDTTDTDFVGYTITLKNDSISNEFKKLSLFTIPTLYFINEGGIVAGVLSSEYDYERYKMAEDIYFNEEPIYLIKPSQ